MKSKNNNKPQIWLKYGLTKIDFKNLVTKLGVSKALNLLIKLSSVMEKKYIGNWLNEPIESFGYLSPIQYINTTETTDKIDQMIYEIQNGTPD